MPKKRHSAEQIVTKLRQIEVLVAPGRTIGEAYKEAEITEQSYNRWRNEYSGLEIEQAKRFKELEWITPGRRGSVGDALGSRRSSRRLYADWPVEEITARFV